MWVFKNEMSPFVAFLQHCPSRRASWVPFDFPSIHKGRMWAKSEFSPIFVQHYVDGVRGKELRLWPIQKKKNLWQPSSRTLTKEQKSKHTMSPRCLCAVIHVSRRLGSLILTLNSNVNTECFIQSMHLVLGRLASRALSTPVETSRKCDTAAHIYMLPELVQSNESWVVLNWVHLPLQGSYKRYFGGKMDRTRSPNSDFHHKHSG